MPNGILRSAKLDISTTGAPVVLATSDLSKYLANRTKAKEKK
jgi:hypothetical protein